MNWWHQLKTNPKFIRLLNWEFWPTYMFYGPMIPLFCWMALKYRHLCFFSATNPGIFTGGTAMESKYETLLKIPKDYTPKTFFVLPSQDFDSVMKGLEELKISFPLIIKPDVGKRGFLVSLVKSSSELRFFLATFKINFIIQEYISYPYEYGVLYYRYPNSSKGHISSLTVKDFLHVSGDGRMNVQQLMEGNIRTKLQSSRLQKENPKLMTYTPKIGEIIYLEKIGNHSRGTTFLDLNYEIDDQLRQTFDNICLKIDGFFYGRFDLKCSSLEHLKLGKGIQIFEINGILSEPTHIYDPIKSTYMKALHGLAMHWKVVGQISAENNAQGIQYISLGSLTRVIINHFKYHRNIKKMAEKK